MINCNKSYTNVALFSFSDHRPDNLEGYEVTKGTVCGMKMPDRGGSHPGWDGVGRCEISSCYWEGRAI